MGKLDLPTPDILHHPPDVNEMLQRANLDQANEPWGVKGDAGWSWREQSCPRLGVASQAMEMQMSAERGDSGRRWLRSERAAGARGEMPPKGGPRRCLLDAEAQSQAGRRLPGQATGALAAGELARLIDSSPFRLRSPCACLLASASIGLTLESKRAQQRRKAQARDRDTRGAGRKDLHRPCAHCSRGERPAP